MICHIFYKTTHPFFPIEEERNKIKPVCQSITKIEFIYWFILTEDPVLANYVSPQPLITYQRSRSLRDSLKHSHFQIKEIQAPIEPITTPCYACDTCKFLDLQSQATLPGGIKWRQKKPVTCTSMGVIYLLQCPCGAYYVGKTSRSFCIRIW